MIYRPARLAGQMAARRTIALERIADALETLAAEDSPLEALCSHVERVAGAVDNLDPAGMSGVEHELRAVVDSLDRLHRQGERR